MAAVVPLVQRGEKGFDGDPGLDGPGGSDGADGLPGPDGYPGAQVSGLASDYIT